MKRYYGIIFLLLICMGCGNNKTDQQAETDSLALPIPDTVTIPQPKLIQPADTTIKTMTLQWQNVSMLEFGPAYEFIDNKGNPHTFTTLNIPSFDFYKNEYFEARYAQGAQFPTIKMKTVGTWYTVTIQQQYGVDDEGVGSTVDVITAIVPLGN